MSDEKWAAEVRIQLHYWVANAEPISRLIERLAAAGAKIVPTEATQAMEDAANAKLNKADDWLMCDVINAAIAAAPDLTRAKPAPDR